MSTPKLSDEQAREALVAYAKYKGIAAHAAAALHLPRNTFIHRLNQARARGITLHAPAEPKPVLDTATQLAKLKQLTKEGPKRYVITAAQNATPVHKGFLAALLVYCQTNKAELVVIPYRYQNPTSVWSTAAQENDWWAKEVLPYLLNQRLALNRSMLIMADISTQPTATRPLSGFDTITGAASAIFAHPKIELRTVPTPQHKLPKILTTTGACTKPNYTDSKTGKKAHFHHTYGAAIVEIEGDAFHLRQINALDDGSFIDLEHEYTAKGAEHAGPVEALIMGDTHQEFVDPAVVKATFGPTGVVAVLKPKYVVWHDVHDFYARNHHHKDAVFINYAKHHAGVHNVCKAMEDTFTFIDNCKHSGVNVFVPSNHPDALNRWVQETDPRDDPENAVFWAETFVACCLGARMTKTGASTIDPFVYWAKKKMQSADKALFLKRDESFRVKGIELGYHGDKGPNGARGAIAGFTKIGTKVVIGHSHSPGIMDGVYQVGLNAYYKLEYASGPSSWLQTDCLVYKNGKRTLINFIQGEWRASD